MYMQVSFSSDIERLCAERESGSILVPSIV